MFVLKIFLYVITFGVALFLSFWELKIKRQLTDSSVPEGNSVFDFGIVNDVWVRMKRERILGKLPGRQLRTYRTVVVLKFVCVVLFVLEVFMFQRST